MNAVRNREWVRTGGGKTIHRPTCHMVGTASSTASTWKWAQYCDNDLDLLWAMGADWGPKWNRFCYFCCHSGWAEQRRLVGTA